MKRSLEPNDNEDEKRNKMEESEDEKNRLLDLRFLIPSKAAGGIIGESGSYIKDLRKTFEMKINISDNPGPERVLNIHGPENMVYKCLETILERVKDSINAADSEIYMGEKNRRRANSSGQDVAPVVLSGVDCRMIVHQSIAGGIIGRRGERIMQMREKWNIKALIIHQEVCPESTDRVVQIVEEIPRVIEVIADLIGLIQRESLHPHGTERNYDPRFADESIAMYYGGWLSKHPMHSTKSYGGKSLSSMPSRRDDSYPARFPRPEFSRGFNRPPMEGYPSGRYHQYPPPPSESSYMPYPTMRPNVYPSGGFMPPPHSTEDLDMLYMMEERRRNGYEPPANRYMRPSSGGDDESINSGAAKKTIQVSVPNSYMGAIMGRGAARIRSIREESGAFIRVHDADEDGGDRIIEITGSAAQINAAQHLLRMSVTESFSR